MIPKVTARLETTALWRLLEGDTDRVWESLKSMTQSELRDYRRMLRELARRVDDEIYRKYNIPEGPIKIERKP